MHAPRPPAGPASGPPAIDTAAPDAPAVDMRAVDWPALLAQFDALVRRRTGALAQAQAAASAVSRAHAAQAAATVGDGIGVEQALAAFERDWLPGLSASAGPRYFGFVTGGATPAALLGDWLAALVDQNAMGTADSIAPQLEADALARLRDLLGLPAAYTGSFVSGATMANFVGLAIGRQWLGQRQDVDVARDGVQALRGAVTVFSGAAHSSIHKALAMAGLGRAALTPVPLLPGREAIDVAALEALLLAHAGPCVVVANAGTVNSVDFDDLQALAQLKQRHDFWLHVDAAFGGFAAVSPRHAHLVAGLDAADSITVDAHKWLNVPYDSAVQFTRHRALQNQVFSNAASYLPEAYTDTNFVHLTPENSRRLRALPVWFTLAAYGREAYAAMVERHCALATALSDWLDASAGFERLAPTRLNGVCFALTVDGARADEATHRAYLDRLGEDGRVFLTPTRYLGQAAIRVSICNWNTHAADLETACAALRECHPQRRGDAAAGPTG